MMEKDRKNNRLDAAIKNVLSAAAASEPEIDEIATKPFTYAAIRSRIDSADLAPARPERRRLVPVMAFGSVVLAAFIAGGAYLLNGDGAVAHQVAVAPVDQPAEPKGASVQTPDVFRPQVIAADFKTPKVKTVFRKRATRKTTRPAKKETRRTLSPDLADTFYALDYRGVSGEAVDGGRVVRLKVPRASLFAMGMNVPLENEAASVEADVMVGPDGVPHAIRLVD
jgi:hypothetical protein